MVDIKNYNKILDTNLKEDKNNLKPNVDKKINPNINRKWFYGNEIPKIYSFPKPTTSNYFIGVVSFGGGLYGDISNNFVLSNSDIQKYWLSNGIPLNMQPTVMVKTVNGAKNIPDVNDNGSTIENTIDVETLGVCCPTNKLVIVLYIAPNSFSNFDSLINFMLSDKISFNKTLYSLNTISISWGATEIYFPENILTSMNNNFMNATNKGINITAATGDYGSNNNVGGTGSYCDFPSSCPYVTAVGGTTLTCPNRTYDKNTLEIAWSSGGGAISRKFSKPGFQSKLSGNMRQTPDIALIADPNTGVQYLINNKNYIIGGTSIASPIFASYLACINYNKFINTQLYVLDKFNFNDIVTGSNGEYKAKNGYDNCSGLGSIIGNRLFSNLSNISNLRTNLTSINKKGKLLLLYKSKKKHIFIN
jgi:kumamolisin